MSDRGTWTPPLADLEASRRDGRLQSRKRSLVEDERRANSGVTCAECGSDSGLAWFWFESPPLTWEHLCGTAGVVVFCDEHSRQVAYFEHVIN